MIRIGILGDIGSGKSFVAKLFGYPVFNADNEVAKIYKKSRACFLKLKRLIPKYIKTSFFLLILFSSNKGISKTTSLLFLFFFKKIFIFFLISG